MIDAALRTMIDEVLIFAREMYLTVVAPRHVKRHLVLGMILSENRFPLFGIML